MIETFEEYASYLDEDFSEEQEELNQRHCDAEPAWDDDSHNDNHHDIERECPL